jgi:glycine/D-amino acid oxidase-like deaminating enzyme/nitrite reductase/ring-hydroxylating ferredoxin subunit
MENADIRTSGRLDPYWIQSASSLKFSKLDRNLSTDVLIIGGGITGITTAYLLLNEGKQVTLIEDGLLCSGETGRTTAHLTNILDFGYSEIARLHGQDRARLVLESHTEGINLIERIAQQEAIPCHFKRLDGYLLSARDEDKKYLEEEFTTLSEIQYPKIERHSESPLTSFAVPSLRFPNQARFHPVLYLSSLARILKERGANLFTETHVEKIDESGAYTNTGFHVAAKSIVIATHSPIKGANIFLKEAPYRSYVLAAEIAKGSIADALYWDTEDPYHYVRLEELSETHDLLIVGGEDHKTGQIMDYKKPFEELEKWTREHFEIQDFIYRWSGQVIEPIDGLAFIGQIPYRNYPIYMATGFSGNGMTYSTLASKMIADEILGKKNPWRDIYNPTRKNLRSIREFLGENLNSAKRFAMDRIKKSPLSSPAELAASEGAIIQHGAKKLAVFKDAKGKVFSFSAVCPHMGCIVQWNSLEKTFDCPCHGSRFTAKGKVINGPSIKDLEMEPLEDKKKKKAA